jgi:hypothetical protein
VDGDLRLRVDISGFCCTDYPHMYNRPPLASCLLPPLQPLVLSTAVWHPTRTASPALQALRSSGGLKQLKASRHDFRVRGRTTKDLT